VQEPDFERSCTFFNIIAFAAEDSNGPADERRGPPRSGKHREAAGAFEIEHKRKWGLRPSGSNFERSKIVRPDTAPIDF
jgi:hypothetical protein